ncbi:leucine-rich repeat domain-containing protein [Aureispira sp. CCB-QB1]|uniref:leucine-rich repeat domain-containing protein n=1 Tax=Aureispira sp. CCB-QB1 TaxID=1313421 RepID=UPI000697CB2A|nr:leucine-rich repeat domain-containing protein [Aureispira sp. CCB-QB1]
MSLYRPNHYNTFLLTILLLFVVVLLLIPLRPSVWDRDDFLAVNDSLNQVNGDTLLQKDSFIVTTTNVQDTQIRLIHNIDSGTIDTNFVVQTTEIKDTTQITILTTPPTAPTVNKAITTDLPSLGSLIVGLLLFLMLTWLFGKWLINRWKKRYWLEYNAPLQPLATLGNSDSSINIDWSSLPLKTTSSTPTAASTTKEVPQDTVTIDPPTIESQTVNNELPITSSDDTPTLELAVSDATNKEVTATPKASKDKNPSWFRLFIIEFFGRLPRILFEIGRGITSIFSFFSTGNQKRKPLDLKWQDGVSVFMILFFLLCKWVIFPYQPTSPAANIIIGLLVWASPALLRLHWGWGVLGIVLIFGEIIGLIVYIVLQALKDLEPSNGDSTIYWIIAAALLGLSFLYWANKKGFFAKIATIKSSSWAGFLFMTIGSLFIFLPYIQHPLGAFQGSIQWGDVIAQLIGLYVLYEIGAAVLSVKTQQQPSDASNSIAPQPIQEHQVDDKQSNDLTKKLSTSLSHEELKKLFNTKNWYKKTALDQLEMISLPNRQLDEQSEFVVLYLPDCINLRQLYLSNNNFKEIPYEISELDQLEVLNLSYNNIHTIFPDIAYLTHLKVLFLANNNISKIPNELGALKQLTQLDLTGNPLTKDAITALQELLPNTTLKFDTIKTDSPPSKKEVAVVSKEDKNLEKKVRKILHKELKTPQQVYALSSLMNQGLSDLPLSVLRNFPNLKSLYLNSNQFTQIPEAIYQLPSLSTISFSYNQLDAIPDRIIELQNIQELDFSGNPIQSYSTNIVQLPHLKKLALGNLGLTTFPAFLLKMQQLESLDLTGNHILRLPENLYKLGNLKELRLNFSGLNIIPNEIFTLKNLRSLDWTGNGLETIPPEIAQLTKLNKLILSFNQNLKSSADILQSLPPDLKEFYISGLQKDSINSIINNIGLLKNLQTLWLSYNELKEVPNSLFDLKEMRRLSLACNQLNTLPEQIGSLSNLEYLYLDDNQLTSLPTSIKKLKKLRYLNLKDNPIDIQQKRSLQHSLPNVKIYF